MTLDLIAVEIVNSNGGSFIVLLSSTAAMYDADRRLVLAVVRLRHVIRLRTPDRSGCGARERAAGSPSPRVSNAVPTDGGWTRP